MNDAAMYYRIMAHRNIVADADTGLFVCTVYDNPVLDIHPVAHLDAVDIASDHGIEPDAAFVAYLYIAYDSSIGRNKAIFSKAGRLSFYR
jgi:hypothetical protein